MTKAIKTQAKKPQKDSSTGLWLDAAGVPIHVGGTLKCVSDAISEEAWVTDRYLVIGRCYEVLGVDSDHKWIPIRVGSPEGCTQWVNPSNYLVI